MMAMITADVLQLIKTVCCQEVSQSDSPEKARWKNAQREVYVKFKHIHEQQRDADETFAQGVTTRVPDFTD